ncbi:MAG: hypothetical protein M4D80_26480 [Myxococcota bacterium]|nr:hypothetical protein [Myxococcota bacterium]
MRWLIVVSLAACTSSHSLRVRAIDGITGRPLPDEKITVKTFLTSRWCEHEERTKPWPFGVSEGTERNSDINNATFKSGRDGWVSIEVIESTGVCNYRTTEIELYIRGRGQPLAPGTKAPVFIPVFLTRASNDFGARTFVTHRAKAAFEPIDAVRSAYGERFLGDYAQAGTAFAANHDTFLVGAASELDVDADRNDPFLRVTLAKVTPSHDAWRVELTALDLDPTAARYVVPPAFAAHRAQVEVWAKSALDEIVLRAATVAKLIDRDHFSTNEFAIQTSVQGETAAGRSTRHVPSTT